MWELYGRHLISGFEFTVMISSSREQVQREMNKRNANPNVVYFIQQVSC
jgi:hypothetical protein